MNKKIIFILVIAMILVGCKSTNNEEPAEEKDLRAYESEYLEAHRENAKDYKDLYGEDLYIDIKLLEDIYDDILKSTNYEQKLIEYKVSEYVYGDFENHYDIVSHVQESESKLDSNVFDTSTGEKTTETIIRGATIFQRTDDTGIKNETSFYKDDYDQEHFYILGLDSHLEKNFSRMIYFLDDAEIEKMVRQPHTAEYEVKVQDMDAFKDYLLKDINDDYIQYISSLDLENIQGVDILYKSEPESGTFTMKIFLEDGEHSLTKKVSKGQDLHFRKMENMDPEKVNLKK